MKETDEERPRLPDQPLLPITNKDLIPAPWSKKEQPKPASYRNSKKIEQMILWIRRYDAIQKLPTAEFERIARLDMGDLKAIAPLFWAYDHESMKSYSREELIQFICGHRQDRTQYRPLPPLPYGALIKFE
jgi:hypothetical protein